MNILSLFDGISCAQLALQRSKLKVKTYFASEIDQYATHITQSHFPRTIQLGDVRTIKAESLPKIDLLIGGSPCQGFSRAGKELNFSDSRSQLFFEYVRLLREVKPTYFILENVKMRNEWISIISEHIGVEPILIDSNLVSAQNRKRLYWTNIPGVTQPEDRKIDLSSVISSMQCHDYFIAEEKWRGTNVEKYISEGRTCVAITEQRTAEARRLRKEMREKHGVDHTPHRAKELVARKDTKMNCLTATFSIKEHTLIDRFGKYRKLTPVEFEKLQTIPPQYTAMASKNKRYRMIGNSFTVDVISHILNFIPR